jgi:glycosyltransferase involved in cell wall biosynthesis
MINIFDCSNSSSRPKHRGGGGPIVNDVMSYLHLYSTNYNCNFVQDVYLADVVITNDVFPDYILNLNKPLVKRMCGPFWQREHQERNILLNNAAMQADHVIFITEYSKQQYLHCYGNNLKSFSVVRHWVDPKIFKPLNLEKKFDFAACATNWLRLEKRLDNLINFIKASNTSLLLIGESDINISNITTTGYLSNPLDICYSLNSAKAFINLSYRDAATKTVPQAVSCGLPILFADSGGVKEMVKGHGFPIKDSNCLDIEDFVPELKVEKILDVYYRMDNNFVKADSKLEFDNMLLGYFDVLKFVARQR